MQLLGAILYDPSTAASVSTASATAMAAIDTSNLRLAFTIPAHGVVRVRLKSVITGATTFPTILLGVMNGATVVARVAPKQTLGNTAVATAFLEVEADFVVTGLTPGAVSWDAAWGVETGVASSVLKWGGPNNNTVNNAWGAFCFEVWDPKSEPTNFTSLSVDSNGRVDVIKVAGTTQTAGDIIADTNDIQSRLPAALTANGNMKSSLLEIISTALTEGAAGRLKAAWTTLLDVASPVFTVASVNQTGDAYAKVDTEVADIQARLPAALVGGRMDASVGAMAANVLTATAINADAITAAKIADGAIDAATFAAGAINAAAIAADAIGASELAADAVSEIQSGLATASALAAVQSDTDDIQARLPAALTGAGNLKADAQVVSDKTGYALSSAGVQAIWDALTSALTTAGSVGKLLVDNINATISSRLASASYTAPLDAAGTRTAIGLASANLDTQLGAIDDYIDTEVVAIKAKTDNLPSDPADESLLEAAIIAATVNLDAAVSSRAVAGDAMALTSGERTTLAGVIWDRLTSAITTAGSIGKLIKDNLDATVSSRLATSGYTAPLDAAGTRAAVGLASPNLDTQLDALPTNAELATALGTADDATLAAIAALSIPTAAANAAAVLAAAYEDAESVQDFLRLSRAVLMGAVTGQPTAPAFKSADGGTTRVTATVDGSGNRSSVTVDPT